ncbi:serine hydrolase domain-containing protein [[Muricauda] lutisoli]|uniref:Beta-lactamase family protein n=1 Tax=[Muricauda] lutisoli TaxID=2816035 RepID=A0ABS3EXH1_9FLAO|nr:serine hydrolase domain-containing protein [[Muricauda] lutisoli]MBO0330850.1 beta-lactamase family protein [[Muricauda] lutisoli]
MKTKFLKVLFLLLTVGYTVLAQENLKYNTLEDKIDNYLSQSVVNGYSGSVLVVKKGEVILSKGYGWADRLKKVPNTPSTVFNIGSVTKQFTAAAILKLREEQKLEVSDKIEKYFPQAPSDKKDITIHQLLTHTSGVSPSTGGFRYDKASKEIFLNDFFGAELMYGPGTKHTYANANYILLTAIIEQVAQQDYETFLRQTFWAPLQMIHTGYKGITFDSEQLAHGYYFHYTDGEWRDWGTTQEHLPYNNEHWYSIGKGDIYSTVEDLYTWHLALENNKVLSAESKKVMEEAHVPENETETSFYGYGWAIFNSRSNSKIVAHNGSNGIYFADFLRFVEDDLVVIALSNIILNQQSENVAWEIASMVMDKEYRPKTIPKNTYELVFDFLRNNPPEKADELSQFIEDKTGAPINDKALLNRIGFKQVSENRNTDWGISLLKLNTHLFPDDGNLWDSLGEGYYVLKDRANAIESFTKAIELGSDTNCYWCENGKKRLEELKNK